MHGIGMLMPYALYYAVALNIFTVQAALRLTDNVIRTFNQG